MSLIQKRIFRFFHTVLSEQRLTRRHQYGHPEQESVFFYLMDFAFTCPTELEDRPNLYLCI